MEESKAGAKAFQEWFKSQTKYKTQKEFAKATGIPRSSMGFYLQGLREPLEEHRKILYEVTGLECFKLEIKMPEVEEEKKGVEIKGISEETELPLNIQLQNWFESQTKYKTKKDLAKDAGIGYSNLQKYFRGDSLPSQKNRQKLYEVTGIEILMQEIEIKKEEQKEIESFVEIKTKDKEKIKEIKPPLDMQEKVTELQKIISSYKVEKTGIEPTGTENTSISPIKEDFLEDISIKDEKVLSNEAIPRITDLLLNQIKEIIQKQELRIRVLEDENKSLRKNILSFSVDSREERIAYVEKLCNLLVEQVNYLSTASSEKIEHEEISTPQNTVQMMIDNLEKVRELGQKLWDIEIVEEDKEKFYSKVKDAVVLLDRLTDKLFKGRKKLIPQGFSSDMLSFLSKTINSGGEE